MIIIDAELIDRWRSRAEVFRRHGVAEAPATLEACADELEEYVREIANQKLSLEEASEESGYSHDHLSRLIRDGTVPNAGEPGSPRIRRGDLPRKPGHTTEPASTVDGPIPSKVQMARSVVNSD